MADSSSPAKKRKIFEVPTMQEAKQRLAANAAAQPSAFDLHKSRQASMSAPPVSRPPVAATAAANSSSSSTSPAVHYLHRPLPAQPASLTAAFPKQAFAVLAIPEASARPPAPPADVAATPGCPQPAKPTGGKNTIQVVAPCPLLPSPSVARHKGPSHATKRGAATTPASPPPF